MRRRIAVAAVAAAAASLITPLSTAPAVAAGTLQCQTAAPIFVRHADTGLQLRTHQEPENGNPVWGANQNIGFAWDGQMRTGPGGRVYEFTPEGEINKFVWTGSGWKDGGVSERIATGWHGWGDAGSKTRMTIDAKGDFYGFPSDNALHWWRYDEVNKSWSERILDTGWGTRYDMIFADGVGGLFARSTDGNLYRYHYDAESQRWLDYARLVGNGGWGQFSDIASVGGGVFYALKADTGHLRWYRYLGEGNWASGAGQFISDGWSSAWQIEGAPDACQILGGTPTPPTTPVLTPQYNAPVGAYQGDDNLLNYWFVNAAGRLTNGKQRHTGDIQLVDYQDLTGYEKFTGEVGYGVYPDGKVEIQANSHEDAGIRTRGQAAKNGAWKPSFGDLAGRFVSAPAIVKGSDDLLVSFAVDASGGLWYRKQLVLWGAAEQGRFGAWRSLGGAGLTADFTAVRNGSAIDVVGRYDGSYRASRFNGTALEAARTTGGTDGAGKPAVVAHTDGKLQVVVRRADGKIYTQREGASGFPGTWQPVGDLTAAGAPAALLTSRGSLEISARDVNGYVYTTGQPNSTMPFRNWEIRDFHEAGTDTTMVNLRDGNFALSWRDPMGEVYVYLGSFGAAVAARSADAGPTYQGGKHK